MCIFEKWEQCPECNKTKNWNYDFQCCSLCGYGFPFLQFIAKNPQCRIL
jgi:hypothetical protein